MTGLKSLLKYAQRRGDIAQKVAADVAIGTDKRGNRKLKVGTDIPTREEIKRIVNAATGKWRPILVTAACAGLWSSEIRGLK